MKSLGLTCQTCINYTALARLLIIELKQCLFYALNNMFSLFSGAVVSVLADPNYGTLDLN